MSKKILQKDASVLRKISQNVPIESIKGAKIQNILKEMKEALESQDDGVAIAAPQIGYSLRIFVVSKRVEGIMKRSKKSKGGPVNENEMEEDTLGKDLVFINPVLKKRSKEGRVLEEGCLSVRYLYGQVKRSNKATVEAYDQEGKKITRGGTGLLAQIFQHEIDHLNGILFIDKAKHLEEIIPPNISNKKIDAK